MLYIVDSTQTRPNGSVDEQPTTIYSSISSSSSSSIATVEDDLTQELENIWKLKSNNTQQNQQKPLHIDINSEEMLLQLLISHAIIDARDYKVLSFEEFEQLKRVNACKTKDLTCSNVYVAPCTVKKYN